MDRRDFLCDVTRLAALSGVVPNIWRVTNRPRYADDPFQLGVASGDPTATGGTLWTRLAPRPQEAEGGMDGMRATVSWELADDDKFSKIVKQGRATGVPELGYSIHVDLDDLPSNRWYFYRFHSGDATSAVGRFRTSPAAGDSSAVKLAVASCQHYENGYWTAYDHMSREEIDLVMHLGDYIYEYGITPGRVRSHNGLEVRTLDDYRRRYAWYKSDRNLRAAHERCPWLVTWDDHEVDNNYAGDVGENIMESSEQMRTRRAAAYQAWWEHQPVRVPRAKSWSDLSITRSFEWGALASIWVLDGRQYRSDQPCGDGNKEVPCGDWADPSRTMLGAPQEKWVEAGLKKSSAKWQVLANQVMMAPFDNLEGEKRRFSMDQWSGYPAARDRMLNAISASAPNRTVVLTGDIHSNWVNELRSDFNKPEQFAIAAEFVGTSISSGGDGNDNSAISTSAARSENPHVKWQQNRRGYLHCEVAADTWTTSYRTVDYISKPDAPLRTPSTWRVDRGRPGISRVS